LLHDEIASKSGSAAGFAKPILQASPDVGSANLLTSSFLHSIWVLARGFMPACLRPEMPTTQEIPMKMIRNYVYAAVLATSLFNFSPNLACAQDEGGSFTLSHEVRWQDAVLPAGSYKFTLESAGPSEMIMLRKISGTPASFMLFAKDVSEPKVAEKEGLVIDSKAGIRYVSAMNLPQFEMTMHFAAPRVEVKEDKVAEVHTASAAGPAR
jgi:hypothetical protein